MPAMTFQLTADKTPAVVMPIMLLKLRNHYSLHPNYFPSKSCTASRTAILYHVPIFLKMWPLLQTQNVLILCWINQNKMHHPTNLV